MENLCASDYCLCGERFTFEQGGELYVADVVPDDASRPPWDTEDGHGPVSDWVRRDKRPGELLLAERQGGERRYYDFAGACRIARRDSWGVPDPAPGATIGEIASRAALADYQRLRGWCSDDWCYVGVVVRAADACPHCADTRSLWSIESDCGEYIRGVAGGLAEELAATAAQVG